jgi:hypothetical protein
MIPCLCRCSTHPSALLRSEPIEDRFTLRWNNLVTDSPHHRKIWRFSARPRHRKGVAVQLIGCITPPRPGSTRQISIAM